MPDRFMWAMLGFFLGVSVEREDVWLSIFILLLMRLVYNAEKVETGS